MVDTSISRKPKGVDDQINKPDVQAGRLSDVRDALPKGTSTPTNYRGTQPATGNETIFHTDATIFHGKKVRGQ